MFLLTAVLVQALHRWAWERVDLGKLLLRCLYIYCSAAQGASAPAGDIVAAAPPKLFSDVMVKWYGIQLRTIIASDTLISVTFSELSSELSIA